MHTHTHWKIGRNVTLTTILLQIYAYLILCGYLVGQLYAILTTLVTPVLSDQFGFTVEYTSHYLIGVAVAFLTASFIQ